MGLFGQIFKTVVNVATLPVVLPVAILADVVTFGNGMGGKNHLSSGVPFTKQVLDKIKEEASE